MSPQFDWRSEEEKEWDEFVQVGRPPQANESSNRRRTLIIVALLIAISGGLLGFSQLRRLVIDRAKSTEEEVVSAHKLVRLAAAQSDPEILASLLPSGEPHWTETQLTLLDRQSLLDRRSLGMEWQSEKLPVDESVKLSSDLRTAEIESTYEYQIEAGNGNKQSIDMRQIAYYRRIGAKWFLSRPPSEFWGETFSSKGRYLTLIYPERDAEVGSRLAVDLEGALAASCSLLADLGCDGDSHLELQLTQDPVVLIDLSETGKELESGRELSIAAPSLIGLPSNEDGYRALFHIYAGRAVAAFMGAEVGWTCCSNVLFYQALMDFLLQRFGISPWPVATDQYYQALSQPISRQQIDQLWQSSTPLLDFEDQPDWWVAYAFVEFLMSEATTASVPAVMSELISSDQFGDWLSAVADSTTNLDSDFERFMQRRIVSGQGAPPIAFPAQDILMVCGDGTSSAANLYRYDLSTESWSLDISDREIVSMIGLPDGTGVLLTEQMMDPETLSTLLLREGHEIVVARGDIVFDLAGNIDPSGQFLPLVGSDSKQAGSISYLLDLKGCHPGGCQPYPVSGRPVWSPSGSRVLFSSSDQPESLSLAEDLEQPSMPIGTGREPFWLDDETFGYLRGGSEPDIVVSSEPYQENDVLLTAVDLARVDGVGQGDLTITHSVIQPVEPRLLFVTAMSRQGDEGYLFTYNWGTDSLSLVTELVDLEDDPVPIGFSPDGRWFVQMSEGKMAIDGGQRRELLLYDTVDQHLQTLPVDSARLFPISDWTVDSEWLVQLGFGKLILTAPKEMYQHLIVHNLADCTSAVWTS